MPLKGNSRETFWGSASSWNTRGQDGDIDSELILLGYGLSPTGFALGGDRIHSDRDYFGKLYTTANAAGAPRKTKRRVNFLTRASHGEAILFAMLTRSTRRGHGGKAIKKAFISLLIQRTFIVLLYSLLLLGLSGSNIATGYRSPGEYLPDHYPIFIPRFILCGLYPVLLPGFLLARLGLAYLRRNRRK